MRKSPAYLKDESGASAAEYALILAIVAASVVTALFGLVGAISNAVNTTSNAFSN